MLKKILVILLFAGTATHCPAQPIHTDYVFSKKELNGAKNLVNHFIQHGYSPKEIATLIAQSTIQEDTIKLVAPSKISKDVIICFAIGAGVGVAAMALIYGTLYTGAYLKEQKAIEVADKKTESAGDIQKQLKEQEDQNQKTKESEQSSEEKNKLEVEEKQTNEKLEQQETLHKIEEENTQQLAKDQAIDRLKKEAEEKKHLDARAKKEAQRKLEKINELEKKLTLMRTQEETLNKEKKDLEADHKKNSVKGNKQQIKAEKGRRATAMGTITNKIKSKQAEIQTLETDINNLKKLISII
jgi:chemotaxis protein histidine kinase CheA